jgi:hypothetical protein
MGERVNKHIVNVIPPLEGVVPHHSHITRTAGTGLAQVSIQLPVPVPQKYPLKNLQVTPTCDVH